MIAGARRPAGEDRTRASPLLLALAAAGALLALVLSLVPVRNELTAFLPRGETPAGRAMLAELQRGSGAGLVLIGLEGAPAPALAALSRGLAGAMAESGHFRAVAGGDTAFDEASIETLFLRRYLLSPAVVPEMFAEPALRAGLETVLAGLGGSAAPLVRRFGLPDPTGAFPPLLARLRGDAALEAVDGAWFAPDRPAAAPRAILLATVAAPGLDSAAQAAAIAAIEAAFARFAPPEARLLLAGPAVLSRDAAARIAGDVERIALLSTPLLLVLLVWRFRSLLILAAIAVPVLVSVAAAAVATAAWFGEVHGIALGFGLTMLGVSVDYPVLLIGHRKRGEAAPATLARIGGAFRLAVATATLGLAGLLFSGFPGLAQLGVFAGIGLLAAAAATWWLLPPLAVAANLAPVAAGEGEWVRRAEGWRRFRALGWAAGGVAALGLAVAGGPRWERSLEALSPVPAASLALDAALRGALGVAETGRFLHVAAPDAEGVLRRQEALLPQLEALVAAGALRGFDAAAMLLPSAATQRGRQAALPDPAMLAERLGAAAAGLPFRTAALLPFQEAVAAARTAAPVLPDDLAGTAFGERLGPLLFRVADGEWHGPILLRGLADPSGLPTATGATVVDVRTELDAVLTAQARRAAWWLPGAALAIVAALALGLRRWAPVLRVLGAVATAQALTVACLTLAGVRLSPIHLVALLLVAGVGLDYALFFARERLDGEERARTLRTLVTCNALTLLSFGLLASCATPVLRDIGATVALGAALSLGCGFLLAAPPDGAA